MKKYMDINLSASERAKLLLSEMSLDEKMAQINCIFPFDQNAQDFDLMSEQTQYGIGEVSTLEMRRMETLEDVAAWQRKVQKIVMNNSPHQIPAIFHMEGLCGPFIQDSTSFPSGISRGASFDSELEEKIAEIVSRQEAACGITHVLAPLLDVARDPRMGRFGEPYGEDSALVSAMGAAYIKGIQKNTTAGRNAESVAKHFLAFHNSQGGIHGTHSETPARLLEEVYGKPFQASITESGLKGIMPCYCSINGESASASHNILTKLLRDDMGFDGMCISDYGAVGNSHSVHHIGETFEEAGFMCLRAGMDIEMPSVTGYNEKLKKMFADGEVDMEILDRAVLRVLEGKFRMGLFENPFALQGEELRSVVVNAEDRDVSLKSARESMVLLKNDGVLPLGERAVGKKIALIGPHAAFARKMFGGYTHMCMMESTYAIANSIAGVSGVVQADAKDIVTIPGTNIQSDETEEFDIILKRQKPDCRSLYEELQERLPEVGILYAYGYPIAGEDESGFKEALRVVEQADMVILTLGGKHGTCSMASMGEGVDSADINLPKCQDAFILKAAVYGKPMIGIHFDGRPISSDVADQYLNAILEAWSPSETGAQAVMDILLGEYNPSGKLPVTVAYHTGQLPIYYNHPYGSSWNQSGSIGFANYVNLPHRPRYYFGYGLSYTTFEYTNLQISVMNDMLVENQKLVQKYEDVIIQRLEHTVKVNSCSQDMETVGILPTQKLRISAEITNTGIYAGDEVVQLYLRDQYASMTRPVKELAGFKRIHLEAGETKCVIFEVHPSLMAFLDIDMRWKVEKGLFDIEVGSSSEDIRLKGSYRVTENAWVDGRERSFYAKAYEA